MGDDSEVESIKNVYNIMTFILFINNWISNYIFFTIHILLLISCLFVKYVL